MHIQAPAKINWFLHVLGKRKDGYHEIVSAMQKISLCDHLEIREASAIDIDGDIAFEDNIMLRSCEALRKYAGTRGVRIRYKKCIPSAAGLGGGSSDAAAVLMALNSIWGLDLTVGQLAEVAREIGSDVPFFLFGNFAVSSGRGEIITPCMITESYDLLLVNTGIPVSSSWAYQHTDQYKTGADTAETDKRMIEALQSRDYDAISDTMRNSLEMPVLGKYPLLAEVKEQLYKHGAFAAMMSGSGSTLFGVFQSSEAAREAETYFSEYWTTVAKTLV